MPPRGGEVRAEQLGTLERLAHEALTSDDVGRLLEELRPYEESQPYDSDEASLIRTVTRREWEKSAPRPRGARGRDLALELARTAAVGGGAPELRLLDLPAGAAPQPRAPPALHRVLRRLRRAVRRPARRLRAGHEDGRGARGVRAAEGGAGAARRGGPRATAIGPRAARPFPIDRQKEFELKVVERFGFDRQRVADRHGRASVRLLDRDDGHPADDALLRGQPRRPLRDDARVRARALRARRRARARADAARPRRVARAARVAEPHVGEHGRPQPPVLALLLPAAARAVPGGARRRRARGLVQRGQLGRAVADPRRGRRGDLQPAHHPALRARAGADRRHDRPRGPAARSGTSACASTSASSRRTTGWACCRTCTGRSARSATSRRTRSATSSPGSSGSRSRPCTRTCTRASRPASSAIWPTGCASALWRHGRKFTPRELVERITGGGLDPEPYLRYLSGKYEAPV